jgi:transcriptional regulator with XRE-family HTH domain
MTDKADHEAAAIDAIVGGNIRAARLERGLSQSQLGARLGITFQQIQKYEKGSNRISAGKLSLVARALDLEVPFFFSNSKESKIAIQGGRIEIEAFTNPDAVKMAKLMSTIPDKTTRLALLEVARIFAQAAKPTKRVYNKKRAS